jgi:hypothetical protein
VTAAQKRARRTVHRTVIVVGDGGLIAANVQLLTADHALDACLRRKGGESAEHLVKGQAVAFSGCFEPRQYTTRDGCEGVAYELHDVALEYGAKPRGDEPAPAAPAEAPEGAADDDIPF